MKKYKRSRSLIGYLPAGREHLTGMYTIYGIRSKVDGRIYVGFTEDIERRIKEHNSGKTTSTKGYRPWELIYYENCEERLEARNREKYLKSGIGKEFIKTKIR